MRLASLFLAATTVIPVCAADHVGFVDFFGYQGIDVAAVRKALRVQDGGVYSY
jgi:hypothetical protein